jgi:tyrosyl-tRNA synthetase
MSKSLGNYIGVSEPPAEIYGKTLSIPDSVVPLYYELLLGRPVPPDLPARDAKRALARELVTEFHDADAGAAAEREFDRVHRQGGTPDEVGEVTWPAAELGDTIHLPELLRRAFGVSSSDARRSLTQGGVSVDGEPVAAGVLDLGARELDGKVVRLGKRRFARVRVG